MNIKQLKEKATASELTLIEAVENAMMPEAVDLVGARAMTFFRKHEQVFREGLRYIKPNDFLNGFTQALKGNDTP